MCEISMFIVDRLPSHFLSSHDPSKPVSGALNIHSEKWKFCLALQELVAAVRASNDERMEDA